MASNHFHVDGPSVFSSWPIGSWHERVHYSQPAGQSFEMNCQDNSQWQLMANNRNVIYRIENSQGDILNIGETNDKVESRMKDKFKENKFIRAAMEQDLYLRIMTPTNRRISTKEAEAVYLNLYNSEHRRLPLLNSKKESEAPVSSNIKVIKIIAIILGGLIILGLIALFYGLANSYNRLEKKGNNISTKII